MTVKPREPNWREFLRTWDLQQEQFNPTREKRFDVMFDVLRAQLGTRFTALDLGSGPGSLSARLLRRFPRARAVAVDYDPVVLRIGQGALGTVGGRLTWVDAKLGSRDWTENLPGRRFNAALSTTALHWLPPRDLASLYRDLHRLLRPGGVFVNGDVMPWDSDRKRIARIASRVRDATRGKVGGPSTWPGWERWWARAEKEPFLRPFFEERRRRHSRHPPGAPPPLRAHEDALRRAGFREVEVVWQDLENRILLAVR